MHTQFCEIFTYLLCYVICLAISFSVRILPNPPLPSSKSVLYSSRTYKIKVIYDFKKKYILENNDMQLCHGGGGNFWGSYALSWHDSQRKFFNDLFGGIFENKKIMIL